MENEGYTREQVFDNFINSQEFSNLVDKLEIGTFNLEIKNKSILFYFSFYKKGMVKQNFKR